MELAYWIPFEVAHHLGEAYAASQGADSAEPDLATLEVMAQALDADPDYLEEVWEVWHDEMEMNGWSEKQLNEARYWLDAVVLDEMAAGKA